MHKNAGDLKPGNQFIMAGGHYKILDIYDTVDNEVVKFSFCSLNEDSPGRFVITISRNILFFTL